MIFKIDILILGLKSCLIVSIFIFSTLSFSASALELKIPKLKKSGSGGADLNDVKLKFTKIFFESALDYMEAQYHLLNALEMNDEAGKTKKSIMHIKSHILDKEILLSIFK